MSLHASSNEETTLPAVYYKQYLYSKSDTNEVLHWLLRNSTSRSFGEQLSVRDILHAAKLVAGRKPKVTAPTTIQDALRRVLHTRRTLTKWYREVETVDGQQQSSSTDGHDYFNNILSNVYDLLFPPKPKTTTQKLSDEQYEAPNKHLGKGEKVVEDEEENKITSWDDRDIETEFFRQQEEEDSDIPAVTYTILDDPLAELVDPSTWLLELDQCATEVVGYFERARDGQIPLVVASTLTTTLIHHGLANERSANRRGTCAGIMKQLDRKELISHLERTVAESNEAAKESTTSQPTRLQPDMKPDQSSSHEQDSMPDQRFRCGYSLWLFGYAMMDFKDSIPEYGFLDDIERQPIHRLIEPHSIGQNQAAVMPDTISTPETLSDIRERLMKESDDDHAGIISLLKSYWKIHFGSDEQARECVLPLQQIMGYLTDGTPPCPHTCACTPVSSCYAWYLQAILDSCKAFVWKDGKPNPVNCRLQALKLAQELQYWVEEVQAVDVEDSIMSDSYLRPVIQELKEFTTTIRKSNHFDLLGQSPLISGRQGTLLLTWALQDGCNLLNQKSLFGTMLHLYKVCHTVTGRNEASHIPALDTLCTVFRNAVFLGDFPTSKFEMLYLRFANMFYEKARDKSG